MRAAVEGALRPLSVLWSIVGSRFFLSFPLFIVHSLLIGGDALGGHIENGRYFVSMHGEVTEVSRFAYNKSLVLGISTFLFFLLVIIVSRLPKKPDPDME